MPTKTKCERILINNRPSLSLGAPVGRTGFDLRRPPAVSLSKPPKIIKGSFIPFPFSQASRLINKQLTVKFPL